MGTDDELEREQKTSSNEEILKKKYRARMKRWRREGE